MRSFMNAMYAMNIILQAFWSLLFPIGCGVLLGWLLVEKCGMGSYLFVILILFGVLVGMISMIRFLISALSGLERLEKEQQNNDRMRK